MSGAGSLNKERFLVIEKPFLAARKPWGELIERLSSELPENTVDDTLGMHQNCTFMGRRGDTSKKLSLFTLFFIDPLTEK